MGVDYPIAVDSDAKVWRDFENEFWPASYIFDSRGRIRYRSSGEGGEKKSEHIIWRLLFETGVTEPPRVLWRLNLLRELSHEQVKQVFTGNA